MKTFKKTKSASRYVSDSPEQTVKLIEKEIQRLSATMTKETARSFLSKLSMYDAEGRLKV